MSHAVLTQPEPTATRARPTATLARADQAARELLRLTDGWNDFRDAARLAEVFIASEHVVPQTSESPHGGEHEAVLLRLDAARCALPLLLRHPPAHTPMAQLQRQARAAAMRLQHALTSELTALPAAGGRAGIERGTVVLAAGVLLVHFALNGQAAEARALQSLLQAAMPPVVDTRTPERSDPAGPPAQPLALQPGRDFAQAQTLLRQGQAGAALAALDTALSLALVLQWPAHRTTPILLARAIALAGLERADEALQLLDSLVSRGDRAPTAGVCLAQLDAVNALLALLKACEAVRALDAAQARVWPEPQAERQALAQLAQAALRAATQAAALGAPVLDLWACLAGVAGSAVARVVQAGLNPEPSAAGPAQREWAAAFVSHASLSPPNANCPHWPWRLRIHALRGLRIERDGVALPATSKAQRKPLDLLLLLVAHGAPLAVEAAIDALWPSLEAEAPRAALDMTVSRLRRLLDVAEAVCLRDGHLSLNPHLVWTDVAAFEHCLRQAERRAEVTREASVQPHRRAVRLADAPCEHPALDCSQLGLHDLLQLSGSGWATPLAGSGVAALAARRAALDTALARVLRRHGQWLEAREQWAPAAELYQRALERQPLVEDFHAALMRCHLRRGAVAEALRVFSTCSQLLQRVLGAAPSPETAALAAMARARA